MKRNLLRYGVLGILPISLLFATQVYATADNVSFAGFASITYGKAFSDQEEGLLRERSSAQIGDKGEYRDMNKLGLQLDADLDDDLSLMIQMVASGQNDYDPDFDWIYMAYQLNPEWTIAIGKTRTPLYLYSDTLDVAYSYIWISTPDAVYSSSIIKSLEGVNITYYDYFGDWSNRLQIYMGHDKETFEDGTSFELADAAGVTFTTIYDDWVTLRATYYQQQITVSVSDMELLFNYGPGEFNGYQVGGLDALGESIGVNFESVTEDLYMEDKHREYGSIGALFDFDTVFVVTEARYSDTESNMVSVGTEGAYLTVGGRLPHRVSLAATYGQRQGKESDYKALDKYNSLTADAFATAYGTSDYETLTKIATWEGTIQSILDRLDNKHEELIISARWDFHSKAALKLEHVRAINQPYGDETEETMPYGWYVSLDLVF